MFKGVRGRKWLAKRLKRGIEGECNLGKRDR